MDQYTRRIIGFAIHAGDVDGPVLCRMFNDATLRPGWPKYISSDNDPLFQYQRWKANLRVLGVMEKASSWPVRVADSRLKLEFATDRVNDICETVR
jgi:transposase InsO family protein